MVQQGVLLALPQARGAGDHQKGRAFGVGAGYRIEQLQSTDAVGDHRHAQTLQTPVGIGGEAGPLLPGSADQIDRRGLQGGKQAQHIITRHSIDAPHAA